MKMKIKIVAVIIVLIACGGLLVWAERPQGDLDGDGTVNNHDLTILANDWLTTGEDTQRTSHRYAVPESILEMAPCRKLLFLFTQ